MTVKEKAAKSGLWFAAISVVSQALSWVFTFYVIRLLDPRDYGLMTMAAFLTAYLQMFSGLGLGSAIVQRETISDGELDSVFWFSLLVGVLMAGVAFGLAYPTALLFNEARVVPVTQLVGLLFVISALSIVPMNLLTREFELRKIAIINLIASLLSSILSVVLALRHYGVFTLIWTNIALNGIKTVLFFIASSWRPRLHYSHRELRPYLSYGIYLALSSASLRLFQSLDKLVIGRIFGPVQLGLYGNAMTIANMPIEKIWPIYQQVSFPLFSRLQVQMEDCYETYLGIARHYLLVMSPIYLGCAVVAPELVKVVLGEKWLSMVPLLQIFCIVKIFEVLTAYHAVLLNAIGRHRNVFWFYAVLVVVVPLGVFAAAMHSFSSIVIPWIVLYPLICCVWLVWGLGSAKLSVRAYGRAVWDGILASIGMFAVLVLIRLFGTFASIESDLLRLSAFITAGALCFGAILLSFQRHLLAQAIRTLTGKDAATQPASTSA